MDGVKLIVGDKCLGMLEAVGEVFPEAKYQRCTVHFYRNVFSVVPRSKVKHVAKMLKAIHAQENKKAAHEKARAVIAELREMKLKEAAKKVEDGIEETLTYCDIPSEHWTRIRTNNVIEGLSLILCKLKSRCKKQSESRRRAGYPVRRLGCYATEIPQPVKGSGAAAVHIPLTGKGFLLPGHPVGVIDRQLGMNDAPILPPSRPFLRDVHYGEIQHFQQAVIRRKNRLGFGDLAKLAIEAFDGVGRVDQPANLLRELEIRAQIRPVFSLGSGDPGILLAPGCFKRVQGAECRWLIHRGINSFELRHERLHTDIPLNNIQIIPGVL